MGILGASTEIGFPLLELMVNHPWFAITVLSDEGKEEERFKAGKERKPPEKNKSLHCSLVFSCYPNETVQDIEDHLSEQGTLVLSTRSIKNVDISLFSEIEINQIPFMLKSRSNSIEAVLSGFPSSEAMVLLAELFVIQGKVYW